MNKILGLVLLTFISLCSSIGFTQTTSLKGTIQVESRAGEKTEVGFAKVMLDNTNFRTIADENGVFILENVPSGTYQISIISSEIQSFRKSFHTDDWSGVFILEPPLTLFEDVVVTGTMKETSKKESTVNVEVFSAKFFEKNPNPSLYDALQNINGVRPQINCNVCNTGDIHINGLEGPYTMVLIDGMPIVSSLSTVYGLSGIPSSMVERMEIVKGPSSTLYGSEAIGGIINVITKNPISAPIVSADVYTTSWLETNADVAFKFRLGKKSERPIDVLTGVNYYNYETPFDKNNDGFTDVTLQDRISIFQKWNFKRKNYRLFSIAGRYMYEDRWGGELDWNNNFRGGDSIYGESIYTSRWEILAKYQLPMKEKFFISASVNNHTQNSFYGNTGYHAEQFVGFGQLHWDKKIGRHDLIAGIAVRYNQYDDSTPATEDSLGNTTPATTWLPGVFVQDEIKLAEKHKLLLGARYDHNSIHGSIWTPRIGYKWTFLNEHILRVNAGTGYRVVNIFTEDHAALTGARDVIIEDDIAPEESYNVNLNYNKSWITEKNRYYSIDLTGFYTFFTNRIVANYDQNPNEIYYANLEGHAISQGVTLNAVAKPTPALSIMLGGTLMDVALVDGGVKSQQILTENFTGTWTISYEFKKPKLSIDYTGNVYSPMRLPLLSELDPRPEFSPWWSIQNIQVTYNGFKRWKIYGGVKNLLNWTPNKGTPFMIARPDDPFDNNVSFDADGNAIATADNPYALTFDPAYVYGPNQGVRGFLGVSFKFK